MSAQIIALSKAKQKLLELVRHVDEGGRRYMIVRDGVPVSVLVPVEEYEAWEETLAVREDPVTMRSLRRGMRDLAAGELYLRAADGVYHRRTVRPNPRRKSVSRTAGK